MFCSNIVSTDEKKNYLINVCIKWDVIITQILFAHSRSFKSFRLKKKSSTLGINKTSESPPMLRRDDNAFDHNNATLDPQLRHTIDVGLSNNFQRGAAYRNSLQDLNSRVRNNLFLFCISLRLLKLCYKNQKFTSRTNKCSSYETIAIVIRCKVGILYRKLNCEHRLRHFKPDLFDRLCPEDHRKRV